MQRLIFEPEHEQFRDAVRRFFQREIAPHAERWREQGYVDREAYLKAGKLGYLLMWADEAYGGAGVKDFRYEQIVYEENIRNGELGFYINLHSGLVAPYIGGLGTEEQKQRFLPKCISGEAILAVAITEPGTGSDIGGIRSHAVDRGDHWLLNGSKTYISNGQLADLIIVVARTVPDKRSGLGLFIVEAGMPGFERGKRLKKMGMAAQDTSELFFHDVEVPKDNVLGDPTQGFAYLSRFLACERLVAAIGSMAAAQTAFDLTLDYVRERRAFGRPIGAFQNTRFVMADLRTQLDVAQTFIDQCVLLHNAERLAADVAAEAKLFSSEVEGRVMDACVQLHGGAGYMEEYRISRMFTDARVTRIFAGSSEIMKEIISRSFGLDDRKLT
ncbi:MAG: acyl-CoA dehydrogenase family protein [Chelatococcus sp.]|uniref:acyl-CoA dehydrogenase family protein n=1 Tax=unclassified Chelatococcus TaxID=2638111 RepID=UPI001BD18069|nr:MULTISPECIES: acyl-CoA dehydrogenase family protein [unclassified Chelatococcus]CAH1652891.1 Acyl-CoA dehydrogenase [Hyphomicrobiales bacterium]MBS7742973.1 acyl-CoA dehydrogenase family protein [Chelatococcus sp. HY11]MBX3538915.1 acyl-CoA dehydrogenase family protein [Chelatococcus sp.]MBX3541909.1 acyl-CoA dehydrogenase family protein [Chelatococcus sp.]MCO5074200.1 acyl-CoA dehydrogenase family protein [Chelatococcus sp.]